MSEAGLTDSLWQFFQAYLAAWLLDTAWRALRIVLMGRGRAGL